MKSKTMKTKTRKKVRKEYRKVGPVKKVGKMMTQKYVWSPTGENAKNLASFLETEEDKKRKRISDLEFVIAYLSGLRSGILAAKGYPILNEEHIHVLKHCLEELKRFEVPLTGPVKVWYDSLKIEYPKP